MRSKMLIVAGSKKEQKHRHSLYLLAVLVVAALACSVWTVHDLEWEGRVSVTRGCLLFLCGLVFFTSLYLAFNYAAMYTQHGHRLVKHYKLHNCDIFDISNKVVSGVQALFCCLTGLTVCTYSCRREMLRTSHFISEAYAWFGAAYFFYDIWSMYKVHVANYHQRLAAASSTSSAGDSHNHRHARRQLGGFTNFLVYTRDNAIIVGHHLFIGAFGFLVITYLRGGLGDCFFGFIYLMEASTPFVSARGILSKMGLKNSRLYVVNGIVMLVTFFVCRVAMFPSVIFMYARTVQLDFAEALTSLPKGCKFSILILMLPQVYWFMLMLNGASKLLKPKSVPAGVGSHRRRIARNAHS